MIYSVRAKVSKLCSRDIKNRKFTPIEKERSRILSQVG